MNANLPRGEADAKAIDALFVEVEPATDLQIMDALSLDDYRRDEGDYLIADTEQQSAEILSLLKCMTRAEARRDKAIYQAQAEDLGRLIHACALTTARELWESQR